MLIPQPPPPPRKHEDKEVGASLAREAQATTSHSHIHEYQGSSFPIGAGPLACSPRGYQVNKGRATGHMALLPTVFVVQQKRRRDRTRQEFKCRKGHHRRGVVSHGWGAIWRGSGGPGVTQSGLQLLSQRSWVTRDSHTIVFTPWTSHIAGSGSTHSAHLV